MSGYIDVIELDSVEQRDAIAGATTPLCRKRAAAKAWRANMA